jgi:four helix bundle protein
MRINKHTDLEVYQIPFKAAMELFQESRAFPAEERYSLTDQCRRSSRSVCSNLAEAWRKRRYPAAFLAKLNDAEGEAGETQTWIQFAVECGYLDRTKAKALYTEFDSILGKIVNMINNPNDWIIPKK